MAEAHQQQKSDPVEQECCDGKTECLSELILVNFRSKNICKLKEVRT
jgi:hypothetical protein